MADGAGCGQPGRTDQDEDRSGGGGKEHHGCKWGENCSHRLPAHTPTIPFVFCIPLEQVDTPEVALPSGVRYKDVRTGGGSLPVSGRSLSSPIFIPVQQLERFFPYRACVAYRALRDALHSIRGIQRQHHGVGAAAQPPSCLGFP